MAKRKKLSRDYSLIASGRRSSEYWDLTRDGVSPSLLQKFISCREQFRQQVVEGWNSTGYSFSIEWGNVWHKAHQKWCLRPDKFSVKSFIEKYRKQFEKAVTPGDKEQQEIGYAMFFAMWPTYSEIRQDHVDGTRDWRALEYPFRTIGPHGVPLQGKCDGEYIDWEGDKVHEMKTKGQWNAQNIQDTLWLDIQINYYASAMESMHWDDNREFNDHVKIKGVTYDVIRRPGTEPYKRKGGGETLQQYIKRLKGVVENDPDYYFAEIPHTYGEKDLESWRKHFLSPVLLELKQWANGDLAHFVNPEALHPRPYGTDLLRPIAHGDFTGLEQVDAFHYHRE